MHSHLSDITHVKPIHSKQPDKIVLIGICFKTNIQNLKKSYCCYYENSQQLEELCSLDTSEKFRTKKVILSILSET